MRFPLIALCAAVFALASTAQAGTGIGARFGARDPRTCASRNDPAQGPINAVQARQYFICEAEEVETHAASSDTLYLMTDVTVEVGNARPFMMSSDAFSDIDPSQPVYPIRGSFNNWICSPLDSSSPGANCQEERQPAAKGICFKSSFGDWHCLMQDADHTAFESNLPPPTGE